ncbi:hypothetical protein PROFUN_16347 [Planoprotostelium fungivorum]|uniref:Uncharacterized protein n=1 Tax=Planoprotostelium fungivorum TaxID=1890364 RepID=A0A2P6MQM3_9EUKA|nr:hypothetical protein PROFUN_16347 [Planoprotostelium fungivorum]
MFACICGLRDTTPPKLAPIYLCTDAQKDCHSISFATFFSGLPTGLQSSKLSVGQQWLSSP